MCTLCCFFNQGGGNGGGVTYDNVMMFEGFQGVSSIGMPKVTLVSRDYYSVICVVFTSRTGLFLRLFLRGKTNTDYT